MQRPLAIKTFYRRNLPHIVRTDRELFLTFHTQDRWILPPGARTIALRHALYDHQRRLFMNVAMIMPDHVHLVFKLLHDTRGNDYSLAQVMKGIKGVSARRINDFLGRNEHVWGDESFDRVLRDNENLLEKLEYVCLNPVRAGLVDHADDYPWLWRSWVEGRR